jgi:hypothetical protein
VVAEIENSTPLITKPVTHHECVLSISHPMKLSSCVIRGLRGGELEVMSFWVFRSAVWWVNANVPEAVLPSFSGLKFVVKEMKTSNHTSRTSMGGGGGTMQWIHLLDHVLLPWRWTRHGLRNLGFQAPDRTVKQPRKQRLLFFLMLSSHIPLTLPTGRLPGLRKDYCPI